MHLKCDQQWHDSALAWSYPAIGITCLYMAIECVVYFVLVILLEVYIFVYLLFYITGVFYDYVGKGRETSFSRNVVPINIKGLS